MRVSCRDDPVHDADEGPEEEIAVLADEGLPKKTVAPADESLPAASVPGVFEGLLQKLFKRCVT